MLVHNLYSLSCLLGILNQTNSVQSNWINLKPFFWQWSAICPEKLHYILIYLLPKIYISYKLQLTNPVIYIGSYHNSFLFSIQQVNTKQQNLSTN